MTTVESRRRAGFPFLLLPCLLTLFALGCDSDPPSQSPPPVDAGADAPTCAASEALCGGACVDLATDSDNCGACGIKCGADEACSNGACALDCVTGQTACSGACVDTKKDLANCGTCGNACAPGEVCSDGICALSCQASLTKCGETCANLASDNENCGACGNPCAPGEACSGGACVLSCQVDLTDCDGTCVDLASSLANCGACGHACEPGQVCSNGACALSCQAGLADCNGLCVDLASSGQNCGVCGSACQFDEVCQAAKCESTTPVDLQLLSISDWHGQIDPINVSGVDIGGAAVLSAYFKNERAQNTNTLTVTAGDAYGASPPLSSFFDEKPAVEALGLMGINADTFGNHNFDRKLPHLQSMIDLATFDYVSSNLLNLNANLMNVASPYKLVDMAGVKVALIGVTNPEALALVVPGAGGTITVADPIPSAMAAKNAAAAAGARVFVAIAHMGASLCNSGPNNCTGPLIDFAKGLQGFAAVFGDHTDVQVDMTINGARVIENRSKGLTYARVGLTVVPWTGVVAKSSVAFVSPVKSAVTPDAAVEAMLQPYRTALAQKLDETLGVATNLFPRGGNVERLGEVAIGNLTADSMRLRYGTELAICNGGGLRAPLPSSYLPADTTLRRTTPGYGSGPPYDLVAGDVFAVLPFGNVVVTRTVTGAQLWAAIENGVSAMPTPAGRFPQISGFGFTYSQGAPAGARVTEVHLMNGMPIPKDGTTYSLATIDFMNTGGDGYTMFADGQGVTRDLMADVLVEYIKGQGTITPTIEGRIVAIP